MSRAAAFAACLGAHVTVAKAACTDDFQCALGGTCVASACHCYFPFGGENCTEIAFDDASPALPYMDPETTTWGASSIWDPESKQYHMFVAEMTNNCGLMAWQTNSQIMHAIANQPEGPYTRRDVAIPVFSHNPIALRDAASGTWLLFHIGTGTPASGGECSTDGCSHGTTNSCKHGLERQGCGMVVDPDDMQHRGHTYRTVGLPAGSNISACLELCCADGAACAGVSFNTDKSVCPGGTAPPCCLLKDEQGAYKDKSNPYFRTALNPNFKQPAPLLHTATSPDGPWSPFVLTEVSSSQPLSCNNPAPMQLANGSMLLACSDGGRFKVFRADSWQGPYEKLPFVPHGFDPTMHNEDWHFFQDSHGRFHVLSHWQFGHADGVCPNDHVHSNNANCGGHFFSTDAMNWHWAWHRSFGPDVTFSNGTSVHLACRQRPQFVRDPAGKPVLLLNGASYFQRHMGGDYSFTIGQPLRTGTVHVTRAVTV